MRVVAFIVGVLLAAVVGAICGAHAKEPRPDVGRGSLRRWS
jgi:hypothetical protein